MKKNFIEASAIIACVSGTGEGQAVYSNRSGQLAGIVDPESVFTPLVDMIEITLDFITETEGTRPANLQPVYTDLGAFHGFIIEEGKGE